MGNILKKNILFGIIVLFLAMPGLAYGENASTLEPINDHTNYYTNNALGYSMQVSATLKIDESAMDVRTRFEGNKQTMDIFYDQFAGRPDSIHSYQNYGNKSLHNGGDFQITQTKNIKVAGAPAHIMYYQRQKLSRISNDKNYYASAEIAKSTKEVYTVIYKSTNPINDFEAILGTFRFNAKTASPTLVKSNLSTRVHGEEATDFMHQYLNEGSELHFGIFEPAAPTNFGSLDSLEKYFDYEFPVVVRYQHMNTEVPIADLEKAKAKGKVVELTLQTTEDSGSVIDYTLSVLNGDFDDYFQRYAQGLKSLDYPVLFRLNNEMNGDWCMYSAYHYGRDADLYVSLYRYIFDIFEKNGANNVLYVWNPNERSFPQFSWNHAMAYYPGDEYVDIVGLTGYNTGNYYPGETWRSFESIYGNLYAEYQNRFNQPMMITEFGSASYGGSKEAWIQDMFVQIQQYPKIKMAVWWSGTDFDAKGKPARVYRINETPQILQSAKDGLNSLKSSKVNQERQAIQ